jgi:hypothetical protein
VSSSNYLRIGKTQSKKAAKLALAAGKELDYQLIDNNAFQRLGDKSETLKSALT